MWMAMRLARCFSREASPAREDRPPASERDLTIRRLRFGGRWPESFAYFDPDSSSSRTWRTFSLSLLTPQDERGETFRGTWPRSAMSARGTVYPLPPLAPRTSVTGSTALLPTPRARTDKEHGPDGKHWGELSPTIRELLPTPLSRKDSGAETTGENRTGGPMLAEVLLPTPVGQDGKNATAPSQGKRKSPPLTHALLPTPTRVLGSTSSSAMRTGFRGDPTLQGLAIEQFLPTPSATEYGNNQSPSDGAKVRESLPRLVKTLPTPTKMDAKQSGSGRPESSHGTTLTDAGKSIGASTSPPSDDGKPSKAPLLNPCFVEWMLGAPARWSDPDCQLSATEFKSRPATSSVPS
jgi:hypothetical protein